MNKKLAGLISEGLNTQFKKSSEVFLIIEQKLGSIPATWGLMRVGTGPGRREGAGFKTKSEAYQFAKKWGHTIVKESR